MTTLAGLRTPGQVLGLQRNSTVLMLTTGIKVMPCTTCTRQGEASRPAGNQDSEVYKAKTNLRDTHCFGTSNPDSTCRGNTPLSGGLVAVLQGLNDRARAVDYCQKVKE